MARSLVELISEHLSTHDVDVPVFSPVAVRLQQTLRRPDFSMEEVTQIIVADQGLSAQILKTANSSFYAGLTKVATIRDAVIRLGAREVANIAMMATQEDVYRSDDPLFNATMQVLWRHALCCAVAARWLAGKVGYGAMAQEAFLAGLLHDVGKVFLLKVIEDLSREGTLPVKATPPLITEVLNSMHVDQGVRLMEGWNLPEIYLNVVRDHHEPDRGATDTLLSIVRLSNIACNRMGVGLRPSPDVVLFATTEAQFLGIREIALAEIELTIEDTIEKLRAVR